MCQSMVDIQPMATEITRGKKERRQKEITGQKYNGLPYCKGDHNNFFKKHGPISIIFGTENVSNAWF